MLENKNTDGETIVRKRRPKEGHGLKQRTGKGPGGERCTRVALAG